MVLRRRSWSLILLPPLWRTDVCTSPGHPWSGCWDADLPLAIYLWSVILVTLPLQSYSPSSPLVSISLVQPITEIIPAYSKKCDKTAHADLGAKTFRQNGLSPSTLKTEGSWRLRLHNTFNHLTSSLPLLPNLSLMDRQNPWCVSTCETNVKSENASITVCLPIRNWGR